MDRFRAKLKELWELIQPPLIGILVVAVIAALVVVLGNLKMESSALWFVAGLGSMLLVDYVIKYV